MSDQIYNKQVQLGAQALMSLVNFSLDKIKRFFFFFFFKNRILWWTWKKWLTFRWTQTINPPQLKLSGRTELNIFPLWILKWYTCNHQSCLVSLFLPTLPRSPPPLCGLPNGSGVWWRAVRIILRWERNDFLPCRRARTRSDQQLIDWG